MRPVLVLVVLLALPVPTCMARATISARSDFFGSERTGFTVFTVSAVGDAADDSLRSTLLHDANGEPDGALVMDTAGAVAAEGCEQVDSTSARCVLPAMGPAPFVEVSLDGGPGNDRLVGDGVTTELRGGPGDDELDGRSHHRPDAIGFAASALRGAPSSRIHAHVPHRRRHGGSPAPAPQRAGTATKLRLLTDAG